MFVRGTVDKTHFFVMPENDAELFINTLPWTPVGLVKQYLILLLETVNFFGMNLLPVLS